MEINANLFAIFILLAANGFFVAAEFALVNARGFRIVALAAEGSASARLTMHNWVNLQAYLLQRIKETAHSRFPVIDGGNDDRIVGILLTKDIYTALISGEHEPWQDLQRYIRKPLVVPETQKVSELFELMRTRRAHLAVVVDEYGSFAGIVSLEDLLEEIVGEIHDETDDKQATYNIESIADNHWEADGLVTLNDLEKAIDFQVADELDANTLSGLFMSLLQRMPGIGDEIIQGPYKLKVLSHADRRVSRVAIERIPDNAIAADDSDDNKD